MGLSPRQMELAMPKLFHDPSGNDPVNNASQDGRKPLWRSTRELFNTRGLPFKSGELAGTARNSYHEERFGWRSGYFIMWDTHPTGTKCDLKEASPEILQRSSYHPIPRRAHNDPTSIRLLPTAHTTSARLANPHNAWDSRSSRAWQETLDKERRSMTTPRRSRVMSPRVCHASHLQKLAVATRVVPPRLKVMHSVPFMTASAPQRSFGGYSRRAVH
jgi:hypothetical protein